MVCATEVYQWFKELPPFNRIDFLSSLMQICLPSELRFIGTLLDDMNNKDYANLREEEDRSNSPNEFRQYPLMPFTIESVRKLCLSLSLLKSTNQKVGQIIYEILQIHSDFANQCMKCNNEFSNEILLLYALACYHPAFTFENRFKIGKHFKNLLANYKVSTDTGSNQNNSCCYNVDFRDFDEMDKFKITITDVKIDKWDADIKLKISTKHNNRDVTTERITKFSKIRDLFKDSSNFNSGLGFSKLNNEINNLTKNGNFIKGNVFRVLNDVIKFIDENNDSESGCKIVKNFFLQLPTFYNKSKSIPNFNTDVSCIKSSVTNKGDKSNSKTLSKYVFQNNSFDVESFESQPIQSAAISPIDTEFRLSDIRKLVTVSIEKLPIEHVSSNSSNVDKYEPEIRSTDSISEKISENSDYQLNDNFDRAPSLEAVNCQDLNTHVPVFQYLLPPYSVLSTSKANSSIVPYSIYPSNVIENVSNSVHSTTNGKMMRSLLPETFILAHCPQRFLPFNQQVPSFVPLFCPVNTSINFAPINEMNYETFPSPRFSIVPTANGQSFSSAVNKPSSSTTPPRLQVQKSSQHSTNFSGS